MNFLSNEANDIYKQVIDKIRNADERIQTNEELLNSGLSSVMSSAVKNIKFWKRQLKHNTRLLKHMDRHNAIVLEPKYIEKLALGAVAN